MPKSDRPITFSQLLLQHPRIKVPLIQRDYAQGRDTEKGVREDFLKAFHGALHLAPEDPRLPLNLDFIYGSMEGGESGSFLPLDGQQRLTTLFLLHWYMAWRDAKSLDFVNLLWDGGHSRFTYGVRPSSTEFFDELVRYVPSAPPDGLLSVSAVVADQSWFFLHWRLDPTIQSVLVMLDAIHGFFKSSYGLYSRLVDEEHPAITFELLPLEHFGLTDDLYIKMNARGKPLTAFETFKARFEERLHTLFPSDKRVLANTEVSVADFFERRIDTQWTDLFWAFKNPETNTFDEPVMNLLLALARVSLNPESPTFIQDTTLLRGRQLAGTFLLFQEHGWLSRDFANNLISLLEVWSQTAGRLTPILPTPRYFDESMFFQKAIQEPATLDYSQLIQFAAFVSYLRHHEDNVQPESLNEWMRVVSNLASSTEIERPEEYLRSLAGLSKLLPFSADILARLSDTDIGQVGFSPQQVREEVLKAKLILAEGNWRRRIDEAEQHGYFVGQIEFLLDFCGVLAQSEKEPATWAQSDHSRLQASFDLYHAKAKITFNSSGLVPSKSNPQPHLWRRALLTVGDYLPFNGSNCSFLTDPPRNWDSWKRFLRGNSEDKRQLLKKLWDQLDMDLSVDTQLEQLIADATKVEPWRAAIIAHPSVIDYCGQQEIRRVSNVDEIYLLEKKQMNGYHAELFSYVLHLELTSAGAGEQIAPLRVLPYQAVCLSQTEPHLLLVFEKGKCRMNFVVESWKGQFLIHARCAELALHPGLEGTLQASMSFVKEDDVLLRLVPRTDIHQVLREVAKM